MQIADLRLEPAGAPRWGRSTDRAPARRPTADCRLPTAGRQSAICNLISAILVLLALAAPARAADTIALVTPGARVAFDKTTGAIVSLADPETGREWLAPGGGKRLYEIRLAKPGEPPVTLTAAQATGVKVRDTIDGIRWSADSHGDTRVSVHLEFKRGLDSNLLECKIGLRNDSGMALQSVRFPIVEFPVRLGGEAADARVLLPICDGLEIQNPEANLKGMRAAQYPGGASMQCLGFYNTQGGIWCAPFDSDGTRKLLGVERTGDTLSPVIVHYPVAGAGPQWGIPYPVILESFTGDWQAVAERYRAWAAKQSWCRTPLKKRKDIPAWAFTPSFYYAVSLRGALPGGGQGDRTPLLAAQVADYHKILGAPLVAMLMSWEKEGPWIAPDYFPPFGGDAAFKGLNDRIHKDGGRSMVFLSGLKWTLHKTFGGVNYDGEAAFKEKAEKWAIVGDDGKVQHFGRPDGDTGEYAETCPATRFARDMLLAQIQRCQELGVDCIQLDQLVGGGMPPCYSKEHGHPPGGGTWSAQAVYNLLDEAHRACHQRNPNTLFTMEEPGEMFIPVIDAYHARDYAEGRWPRDGAGVRGVPLFTYVYHDYCLGYGGDSAPLNDNGDPANAYAHALNLINGKIPAGAVWSRWQPVNTLHPDQVTLLRNAISLLGGPGGDFLTYGRRLATPAIKAEPLLLHVPSGAGQPEERQYPSVLCATYELPGGRVGRVFLNMGAATERMEVPISAMGLPGQRVKLTLYSPEEEKGQRDPETVLTPSIYRVSLPPLVPVILETAPAGWQIPQ